MAHFSEAKGKSKTERVFNVCVVGLSGYDNARNSLYAVGKSCLCSRFVRPSQDLDEFHQDHSSIFSTSDFAGSVLNNDHFLYWGKVEKTWDDGTSMFFRVIEQTEFVDETCTPLTRGGQLVTYAKRCVSTKLNSPGKIMYISRDQVALQSDYEQTYMDADGKLQVDGFVCVYDVSENIYKYQNRISLQEEVLSSVITSINKARKPVVIVATKCDCSQEALVRQAHHFVHSKKMLVPLVESSAEQSLNIDIAFQTVAQMAEGKGRFRTKLMSYQEGHVLHLEKANKASDRYLVLIKSSVSDKALLMSWSSFKEINSRKDEFQEYLLYWGCLKAQQVFNQQAKKIAQHYEDKKLNEYLNKLPDALDELLPSLQSIEANEWKWELCQKAIKNHILFDKWFVILPNAITWNNKERLFNTNELRIPMDVLPLERSRACFDRHVKKLRESARKQRMKIEFRKLLEVSHEIRPGTSWADASHWLSNEESYKYLDEHDRKMIFETYLRDITLQAKIDFQELLFESAMKFTSLSKDVRPSDGEMKEIYSYLEEDDRYKNLENVGNARDILLFNHIALLQSPNRCLSGPDKCMDRLMQQVVEMTGRRDACNPYENDLFMDGEDEQINILVLGEKSLATELEEKIRLESSSYECLEYILDGQIYGLNLKVLENKDDDKAPAEYTQIITDFRPQGYLAIYSNHENMSTLKAILQHIQGCEHSVASLPMIILMASGAIDEPEIHNMRREGQNLANSLDCVFVDHPFTLSTNDGHIHESQVQDSIRRIVGVINKRAKPPQTPPPYPDLTPDLRILLCSMCGDEYPVELILGPLLHHHYCYSHPEQHEAIMLEAYLGNMKRTVSITLGSYHRAYSRKNQIFHGFILVYSATRLASLETLRAFATTLPAVPIQVLAVTGSSSGASVVFHNETAASLLADGTNLASKLSARFQTTSPLFQKQAGAFATFFSTSYDKRSETELIIKGVKRRRKDPLPEIPRHESLPTSESVVPALANGNDHDYDTYASIKRTDNPYSEVAIRRKCGTDISEDSAPSSPDHRLSLPVPDDARLRASTVGSRDDDSDIVVDSDISALYAKVNKKAKGAFFDKLEDDADSGEEEDDEDEDDEDDDLVWQDNMAYESRDTLGGNGMPQAIADMLNNRPYATVPFLPKGHKSIVLDYEKFATLPEGTKKSWAEPEYASIDQLRAQIPVRLSEKPYDPDSISSLSSKSKDSTGSQADVSDVLSHGRSAGVAPSSSPMSPRKEAVTRPFWMLQEATDTWALSRKIDDVTKIVAPLARPEDDDKEPESVEVADLRKKLEDTLLRPSSLAGDQDDAEAGQDGEASTTLPRRASADNIRGKPRSDSQSLLLIRKIIRKVSPAPSPTNSDPEDHARGVDSTSTAIKPRRKLKSFRSGSKHHTIAGSHSSSFAHSSRDGKHNSLPLNFSKSYNIAKGGMEDERPRKQKGLKSKKHHHVHPSPAVLPLVTFNDDNGEDRVAQTQTLDRKKYKKRNLMASMKLSRDDSELPDDTSQLAPQPKKKINKNISIRLPKPKKKQSDLTKDWEALKAKNQKFKDSRYFGQPLEAIVEPGEFCPAFVKVVIRHVEATGLQSEGLYRISGNKGDIEAVMEKFESNPNLNLQEIGVSVHAVTGALKNFFKLLPDPLVPQEFSSRINDIMIIMDADERLKQLQSLVDELPRHNLEVFKLFMMHLKRVTEHKNVNKMDVRNLQTVLYPTLMRPAFESLSNVAQNLNMGLFIQTCIEQAARIFDTSGRHAQPTSILSPTQSEGGGVGSESSFEFDLQQSLHGDETEYTSLLDSVLGVESGVSFAVATPSKPGLDAAHADHNEVLPAAVPSTSDVELPANLGGAGSSDNKGPTKKLFLDLKSPSEISKSSSTLSPVTPSGKLLQSPSRSRKSIETVID